MPFSVLTNTFSASPLPDPGLWAGVPIDWSSTARQFTQWITNNLTGEVTTRTRHVIHVAGGLNYLDSNGSWQPSKDLIEITPGGGAAALHAPDKVYFSPALSPTPEAAIRIVTRSNLVFTTYPIGVYFLDPSTGKEVLLAALQDSVSGTFQPPNRILYASAFHSDLLEADLRVTCTKAAVECDTIITRQPKLSPQDFSMDPSSTLLQVRHAWTAPVPPTLVPRQDATGLADTSIDFGDILFSPGRAFAWDGGATTDTNTPAAVTFFNVGPDGSQEPVGRTWQIGTNGNPSILTESVLWAYVQPKLAQLPLMAKTETVPGGDAPSPARNQQKPTVLTSEKGVRLAAKSGSCPGFVLDWIVVSGSGDYNFKSYNGNNTYWLQSSAVFNGTVTFNTTSIIKRAPGTTLTLAGALAGQVVCNGTCQVPSIITEQDDNMYGEQLSQNCASIDTAVALLTQVRGTSITGMNIRYAGTGIEFYGECCTDNRTFQDSTLESCQTGVYAYASNVTLQNSAISCVTTPSTTGNSGSVSGTWGSTCNKVSLEGTVVTGMQTLTRSHNPANWNIFTGSGPTSFSYNPNCWFYGLKGYTAFSPWNSKFACCPYQGGGTLVTPKHAITVSSSHGWGSFSNQSFTFVGKDNVNYQLLCTNQHDLNYPLEDIGLLEFSNTVPASDFDFVRILPTTFINKVSFDMTSILALDNCLSRYLPCIGCTQDKAAYSCDMYSYNNGGGPNPYMTPSIWFPSYTFPDIPRGGDSGSPVFVVLNNELILIGPWVSKSYFSSGYLATSWQLGSPIESSFTGYLGFQFNVTANSNLGVDQLGRFMLSGNSNTHLLSLVDAHDNKWQTSVTMNGTNGTFEYNYLNVYAGNPFPTLYPGSTYYLMSHEVQNQDQWYNYSGSALNDTIGTINLAAFSSDLASFSTIGSSGESYVPVNLSWFSRPISGTPAMAGAVITQINNIVNPEYSVSTIDLSTFPDHIR